jgi:5-methylcytosine-specific restriction endonuclease McrA
MTYSRDQWAWRKADYRRKIGLIGRAKANVKVKSYHQTQRGKLALKAGSINTSARNKNVRGRVTGGCLVQVICKQGGGLNKPCVCPDCKKTFPWSEMEWDHKIPLCAGGKNEKNNLQLICPVCHIKKTSREKTAMSGFGRGIKYADEPGGAVEPIQRELAI